MTRHILSLTACLIMASNIQAQLTFEHNGLERSYYMEAPDPLPEGAPLVFVLHGYTSSAELIRAYSGWPALAAQEGFVAIFPNGTLDQGGTSHWNANLGTSGTDDHGFLVELAQHLQETYNLSPECTYSCGMSNGGFMSYSLACEHPEVFKAVGSVTGAMSAADIGCIPDEIVPIVHLHGTDDLVVSYDNGVGGSWGGAGVEAIIGHWTGLMGTTAVDESPLPNQEQVDLTSVDFFRYYGAPGGQEFHHYRVNGGGHDWFGVWGSMDVVSTEVMWDFFSAQCAGEFTGVSESSPAQVWLEWTRQGIRADRACLLEVFDAAGRCTAQHRMFPGETWAPATSGITLIRGTDSNGNQEVLKAH